MVNIDPKTAVEYIATFFTLYFSIFFLLVFIQHRGSFHKNPKPLKQLPKISIIIPAFNEEETIAESVESALKVEYPKRKKEILVINDGSTDGTARIAGAYRKEGVKVYNKKNGGKASAMNFALKRASGALIATLDADSYMEKDSLKKMTGFFRDKNVVAVTSVMKVWKQDNLWRKMQGVEYVVSAFTRRLQSLIDAINVTPGPLSVFKAEIFKKIGGFDETNLLEDQEMALRIQKNNYKIKSSTEALVYTNVPSGFRSLLRQRIRWYRGGIRNFLGHYYLVSPKYGDFGIFIMPFGIFSIFVMLLVVSLIGYSFITEPPFLQYIQYGFTAVLFGITPIQLITVALLLTVAAYNIFAMKHLENEFMSIPLVFVYLLFYTPIIILFWAASFAEELRLAKLRW